MKKELQPHDTLSDNMLSDGSRYYGNGIWGLSALDLQRVNLSNTLEKPKIKEEPNNHLLLVSQESVFGRFFQTASKIRLPAKFVIPVGLAIAVLATACGSKNSKESKLPSTPRPSESGAPPPENPLAVLNMPFPKDRQIAIQQGWFYTGIKNREHKGIDYVNGHVDNSDTWKSFSVLAAADGFACANPPSREGNAVLLTHQIGDTPIGSTYYGHLDAIKEGIPACDDKGKTPKFEKQGAKLGEAGATGVKDDRGIEQPTWKHLHFQVNDANGNSIDPYDLRGERDIYPDPNFKNGKPCGPKALFIDCYPKGTVVASPKDPPISPFSGSIKEKSVSATPSPTTIPTLKPTETAKPAVEKKTSLSKNPEELYRALLTSSVPDGILPQNVTLKDKSAGNLDDTARALNAIGQVNIILLDKNLLTVFDNPNAGISYIVFPDNSSAKSAYEAIASSTNIRGFPVNKTELKDFAYPALVFFSPLYAGPTFIMAFENVLIKTVIAGPDSAPLNKEAIRLGRAATEHLKKVGQ